MVVTVGPPVPTLPGDAEPFDPRWDRLQTLAAEHGPGYFVADLVLFRRNYRAFLHAFQSRYTRTTIAYSYKTNYIPSICRAVDDLGGRAEVVSGMEYDLAVALGVDPRSVVYNGPWKPAPNLRAALLAGATVNLDGPGEIDEVERIAAEMPGRELRVGLRCNLAVPDQAPSRFGFDVDGGALEDAVRRLRAIGGVRLAGLHSHVSSSGRSPETFRWRAQRLVELSREYFADAPPEFLNLGGGYFGHMPDELRAQFTGHVPGYEEYAEAVAEPLARAWGAAGDGGPELIVEPGTALVSDVLLFVAAVLDVKTVRGRRVAVCAGSVHNIKPTLHGKTLPCEIVAAPGPGLSAEATDLVGYTCMEHDVLRQGLETAPSVGDYAVFRNVGAYTVVMQPPFIMPPPPIITWDPAAGDPTVTRRPQGMADVFAAYDIPAS